MSLDEAAAPHVLTEETRARLQAACHAVNAMIDAARSLTDAATVGSDPDTLDALATVLDAARMRGRALNDALDSVSFPG